MIQISKVSISMLELDRLKCIQRLIDKQLKQKAVAERLGLTVRQVRRLVERYELEGPRLSAQRWYTSTTPQAV